MKPLQFIPKFLCALALCLSIPTSSPAESYEDEPLPEDRIHLRHIWTYEYPENKGDSKDPVRIFLLTIDSEFLQEGYFTDVVIDTNVGTGVILGKIAARNTFELGCIANIQEDPEVVCNPDRIIINGATALRSYYDYKVPLYVHNSYREDIRQLISESKYPRVTFSHSYNGELLPEASDDLAQQATEVRIMQERHNGTGRIRLTFPPDILVEGKCPILRFSAHNGVTLIEGIEDINRLRDPRQPDSLRIRLEYVDGIDPTPREGIGISEVSYSPDGKENFEGAYDLNIVHDPFRALPIEVRRTDTNDAPQ